MHILTGVTICWSLPTINNCLELVANTPDAYTTQIPVCEYALPVLHKQGPLTLRIIIAYSTASLKQRQGCAWNVLVSGSRHKPLCQLISSTCRLSHASCLPDFVKD